MLARVATLLSIGDFSRMTFLSVKALRYYHDVGLLTPAEIDPASGYRRYELAQVPTAQVIRRLRDLGMPLDEVRHVMDAPDVRSRNAAIGAHLRRMEGELERTRATVESLRLLLDEDAPPSIAVEYREVGAAEALAIREHVALSDLFDWLGAAFTELRSGLGGQDARRTGPDAGLYPTELFADEEGDVVALVPVEGGAEPAGRVERLRLEPVEDTVAVRRGSLDDVDRTFAALGTVVAERAIGVQGPIRETYVVGAFDTPDEVEHRTEICWPVFGRRPRTAPPAAA